MGKEFNITSAKYQIEPINEVVTIKAIIYGVEMFVPTEKGNRHYDEIMRQVDAGELTIEEAD